MELLGQVLANRYRIDQCIGCGAMGIVYRARHVKLARSFAIKVLHAELYSNEKVRRRFEREAEVAATLRHDNVIGVVDVGETAEGRKYIVMDFAEGQPLSWTIAQGPMSAQRVLRIARQLCDGLQHAHEAGLIHRDFKPDNVIVQTHDGVETARVVDFGIALLRDEATGEDRERLTTAGIVLGTPHYMAPEHASGGKVDHRIDLFALGVICFEMLTGRLPFDGDGVEVARSNMMFDTPRMKALVPHVDVDPLLEAFTRKLMARSLDERLPTAKAARELLDLIDRDRDAAMMALGLADRRPTSTIPPPMRPMLAMPIVSPTRVKATTVPPDARTSTVFLRATTEQEPMLWQRRPIPKRYIAAATLLVMLVTLGALAWTAREEEKQPAPVAAIEPVPSTTPLPQPPSPSPAIATEPDPLPVVVTPVKPPPARITAKMPVTTRLPTAHPMPVTTLPPPDTTPTAAELAQYYGAVGRKLGQLERTKGQEATLELWPRYRLIRIQAMLANPEDRRAGAADLIEIEHRIDAAMR